MTDTCLSKQLEASNTFGPSTQELSDDEELGQFLSAPMPKPIYSQRLPRRTHEEMKRDFQYSLRLDAYRKAIGV